MGNVNVFKVLFFKENTYTGKKDHKIYTNKLYIRINFPDKSYPSKYSAKAFQMLFFKGQS